MTSPRCPLFLRLFLTGMFLGLFAAQSDAQRVQPMDVWLACKSPEAFDPDEIRSVADPQINANPALRYLCREMEVPVDLRSWRPVAAKWDAALMGAQPIPTPAEIVAIASGALQKLQRFNDLKAGLAESAKWSRLSKIAVYFGPGETTVPPEDSITVREFAAVVREFQSRFPGRPLTILGSTDPEGDSETNRRIATARAVNLKIAIVRQGGIDESLLEPAAEVVRRDLSSTIYLPDGASEQRAAVAVTRDAGTLGSAGARKALNPTLRTATIGVETTFTADATSSWAASRTSANGSAASRAAPNWAVAVTDVVIERARTDLTVYLVGEAAFAICSDVIRKSLFPTTCTLVGPGSTYQPTAQMLRVAVISDVAGVFKMAFAVPQSANPTFGHAVAANLVWYGLDLVSGRSVGDLVPEALDSIAVRLESRPAMKDLVRSVAEFTRTYDAARMEIPFATLTEAKYDAVAAALRAVAVTIAHGDFSAPPSFQILSVQASTVVAGLAAWDEAVKNVREARGSSADVRLRAVSEALGTGIDALITALPIAHVSRTEAAASQIPSWSAPIRELVTAYAAGDYRTAFFQGLRFFALTGNALRTDHRIVAFAAEFASAGDESGMREALRQFISQGGGYQAKRSGDIRPRRRHFTTLNAYVGIAGGREWTVGSGGKPSSQGAAMLGLGLEHGWRIGPDDTRQREQPLRPRSFSVFLQVIDLGAIAAARIKNDDVDVPPARLTQVLSPGLYGIWSVGRSPLAIGVGAAFAPDARIVTDPVTSKERSLSAVRASLFIAGDVPLFP